MTEFITKLKMLCGLQNVFIKSVEYCNDPHEYSELIGEWNEEVEKLNERVGRRGRKIKRNIGRKEGNRMHKCISAEWAKLKIEGVCSDYAVDEEATKALIDEIDDIQAEDVKRNVYGMWIEKEIWKPVPNDIFPIACGDDYDEITHSEKDTTWICNMCGKEKDSWKPTDNFCSNCGADMRERRE